jgi:hypothetical protein
VFFRLLVRGFVFNERFVPADHRQRVINCLHKRSDGLRATFHCQCVKMPMEKSRLCAFQATQSPNSIDHSVREESLHRPRGRQFRANCVAKLLEAGRVLTRQDDVTGQ